MNIPDENSGSPQVMHTGHLLLESELVLQETPSSDFFSVTLPWPIKALLVMFSILSGTSLLHLSLLFCFIHIYIPSSEHCNMPFRTGSLEDQLVNLHLSRASSV